MEQWASVFEARLAIPIASRSCCSGENAQSREPANAGTALLAASKPEDVGQRALGGLCAGARQRLRERIELAESRPGGA